MTVGFKCPHCHSSKVWRKGKVPHVGGPRVRYVCYDCGKSFYRPPEKKSKRG